MVLARGHKEHHEGVNQRCVYVGSVRHDEEQKRLAEASRQALIESGRFKEIFTKITEAAATSV